MNSARAARYLSVFAAAAGASFGLVAETKPAAQTFVQIAVCGAESMTAPAALIPKGASSSTKRAYMIQPVLLKAWKASLGEAPKAALAARRAARSARCWLKARSAAANDIDVEASKAMRRVSHPWPRHQAAYLSRWRASAPSQLCCRKGLGEEKEEEEKRVREKKERRRWRRQLWAAKPKKKTGKKKGEAMGKKSQDALRSIAAS